MQMMKAIVCSFVVLGSLLVHPINRLLLRKGMSICLLVIKSGIRPKEIRTQVLQKNITSGYNVKAKARRVNNVLALLHSINWLFVVRV